MGDESHKDVEGVDERLRAVIADDDPFARRVIKDVLTASGVLVIAEARNGRQAVEFALYYRPDVVIMDVVMPELDGILATRQILKVIPDQLVIVLTGIDEDDELGLAAGEVDRPMQRRAGARQARDSRGVIGIRSTQPATRRSRGSRG